MEILASNPILWIIIATVVFILALIGFLTESLKKKKEEPVKEEPKVENNVIEVEKTEPVESINETKVDDWSTMPEVNAPLEEVKVDTIETPVAPVETETSSVETPAAPVETETLSTDNNNIWNM